MRCPVRFLLGGGGGGEKGGGGGGGWRGEGTKLRGSKRSKGVWGIWVRVRCFWFSLVGLLFEGLV